MTELGLTPLPEPDAPESESPRRKLYGWNYVAFSAIVGGILAGVLANVSRYSDVETELAGVGIIVGIVGTIWFGRKLRWKIAFAIIGAYLAMIMVEIPAEQATNSMVRSYFAGSQICTSEEEEFYRGLASIFVSMASFNREFDASPAYPPYTKWADAWRAIADQYEALPRINASEGYIETAIRASGDYAAGFDRFALNDGYTGMDLLQEGDELWEDAQLLYQSMELPHCSVERT